ncbi:transcription factor FAMA-like isoform X3 [Typha angustifolia]|uniref:transcription factor FAMA-like isoform X3 n=1 Tax=Typha angustifolia TaxID=59011 RepID=UPI003C2CF95E
MDEEVNHPASFAPLDYSLDCHPPDDSRQQGSSENGIEMVDYMLSNSSVPQTQISLDKLSFADVMQFADFGPKLKLLNQTKMSEDENYHALFPLPVPPSIDLEDRLGGTSIKNKGIVIMEEDGDGSDKGRLTSENTTSSIQQFGLVDGVEKTAIVEAKNRRKRPRSLKTSEEVESQRMTHIAVERNRRRQMNEHLRVLRSLMPGSYVQRASIIGGAIEFVRELEQLVQCLESQKRRRLHGSTEAPRTIIDSTPPPVPIQQPFYPYIPFPDSDNVKLLDLDQGNGLREETVENKSYLADIEVRLLGIDAVIKILSRRRPGQLIKTIAALEELQLSILHTNITTIEQTVLYSFNIKVRQDTLPKTSQTRCSRYLASLMQTHYDSIKEKWE